MTHAALSVETGLRIRERPAIEHGSTVKLIAQDLISGTLNVQTGLVPVFAAMD